MRARTQERRMNGWASGEPWGAHGCAHPGRMQTHAHDPDASTEKRTYYCYYIVIDSKHASLARGSRDRRALQQTLLYDAMRKA